MASTLQYTELPERAKKAIENFLPDEAAVGKTENWKDPFPLKHYVVPV